MQVLIFHRPVSCAAQQYMHTTKESIKDIKTHAQPAFSSEKLLRKDHAAPVTDDFANIKTEKAATDVFQVA